MWLKIQAFVMNRKRTRLSLSRPRKKAEISGREVTKSEVCASNKSSEVAVESKQSLTEAEDSQNNEKVKFSGQSPESSEADHTVHNNGKSRKKSIATWFKKPCSPKSVSCPMCGKHVILSKINQHLDSSCKLHVAVHVDVDCTANELIGVHSCSPRKSGYTENRVLGPSSQKDKKEHKPNVKCLESRDENLAPAGVSSILKPTNLEPDCSVLKKKSKRMVRKKRNHAFVDEGCTVVHVPDVCDSVVEQDSAASQEPCNTDVTKLGEENLSHGDGILHVNETNTYKPKEELNKSSMEEVSENSKDKEFKDHEPYYLANFKLVLNNVLSNKDDRQLFNEADNDIIDTFNEMPSEEQKLYIRLFQRKHGWFRCSKIEYPRISNNLTPILKSLVEKGKV